MLVCSNKSCLQAACRRGSASNTTQFNSRRPGIVPVQVPLLRHKCYVAQSIPAAKSGRQAGARIAEQQEACLRKAGAAVLSALLVLGSPAVQPAEAGLGDLQLEQQATANQYTSLAKPLPKQPVNKGRVWTVLVGGAAVLFTSTVLLENFESFFPAIARANKAMALARKKAEQQERKQKRAEAQTVQAETVQQQQSAAAVEAGLTQARQKVLGESSVQQQGQPSPPVPPPASTSFPAQLDSDLQGPSSSSSNSSSSAGGDSSGRVPASGSSVQAGSQVGAGAPAAKESSKGIEQSETDSSGNDSSGSGGSGNGGSSGGSSSSGASTSSSDGKAWLTNEEINAARPMRMESEQQPRTAARAGSTGSMEGALQPGEAAGGSDSAAAAAAAAAAAVAVAAGSRVSKTARLESFVGGVMNGGNRAGFLSAMKKGGGLPRS